MLHLVLAENGKEKKSKNNSMLIIIIGGIASMPIIAIGVALVIVTRKTNAHHLAKYRCREEGVCATTRKEKSCSSEMVSTSEYTTFLPHGSQC